MFYEYINSDILLGTGRIWKLWQQLVLLISLKKLHQKSKTIKNVHLHTNWPSTTAI